MGRSDRDWPGAWGGASLVMWTTVQSASIQIMSKGKSISLIQKEGFRACSKTKSIPASAARGGWPDSPRICSADVTANSTRKGTPPKMTTGTPGESVPTVGVILASGWELPPRVGAPRVLAAGAWPPECSKVGLGGTARASWPPPQAMIIPRVRARVHRRNCRFSRSSSRARPAHRSGPC